ncbi:hypothetical protein QRD89_03245 [Halobacillus sp. ACCC02827]|uniref:hypothetical protein n=1 Tax=unclassified Halobacillus TaxID=2636472 RepID=UPI0013727B2F|nr:MULTISPECIES: hypothetical protein [unclassified Halobacillus]WJE16385.1 hypothetical protein QRD89_03245 [Halobacillus sp. ACCC02827]
MKMNLKSKKTWWVAGLWVFTSYYTFGFLSDKQLFPITDWLKAVYLPVYHTWFGGP